MIRSDVVELKNLYESNHIYLVIWSDAKLQKKEVSHKEKLQDNVIFHHNAM